MGKTVTIYHLLIKINLFVLYYELAYVKKYVDSKLNLLKLISVGGDLPELKIK